MRTLLVATLLIATPALAVPITAANQFLGGDVTSDILHDVSDAGDVNLDGISDMLLGDPLAQAGTGTVWIDFGGTPGLAIPGAVEILGSVPGDRFGYAVSGDGRDFNCDGFSDVVVGAPGTGINGDESGAVHVFLGPFLGGSLNALAADFTLVGEAPGDQAGFAVDFTRDVDGDGCNDIVAGAPFNDALGLADAGAAYIIGSASTPLGMSQLGQPMVQKIAGDQPGGALGFSVSDAGDHNGDGRPDVVLGAPRYDGPGAVFVAHAIGASVLGSAFPNPVTSISTWYMGELDGDAFGHAVDGGRDVDQDGRDDIMVGAPRASGGSVLSPTLGGTGAAYLFVAGFSFPSPGVINPAAVGIKWVGSNVGTQFGHDVSFLYDVNGDGREDMAVGEPYVQVGPNGQGQVHALLSGSYTLSPTLVSAVPGLSIDAVSGFVGVGYSIDRSLDNDGDARPDPLIGFFYRPAARNGLASF